MKKNKTKKTEIISEIVDTEIEDEIFNFRLFAPKFLKIKTKQGDIVNFKFNQAQLRVLDQIDKLKLDGVEYLRLIILKARQQGISTLFQALIFHELLIVPLQKCMTLAHKTDASSNLFDMYKRFYDYLPEYIKPTVEASNEKKVKYGKTKSENKIATAGGESIGRSDTLQYLHATEIAFYGNASKAMLDVLQSAKYAKMIVIESTANGIGDEFYNRWQDAKNKDSDYIPIFLSWLDFPEYTENFKDESERVKLKNTLSDREKSLIANFKATLEQLNWRRKTIKNDCGGDEDKFAQEYPANDAEAFISSGRPVFNSIICKTRYESCQKPLRIGNLEYDTQGEVVFVDDPKGYIKIFETISVSEDEFNVFAAGSDVAEGLKQGDFSVIRILDRRTMKVCMEWHGHIDPDKLADEQLLIQKWLKGKIYFATERNNHGLTTITSAYKQKVKQYTEEDFTEGKYPEDTGRLGWKTNSATKPHMLNHLKEWIRDELFTDNGKDFWKETLTFVKNAKGQMQAQNKDADPGTKCYDDRVIATAIMIMCHLWMGKYYKKEDSNLPLWAKKKQKNIDECNSFMTV